MPNTMPTLHHFPAQAKEWQLIVITAIADWETYGLLGWPEKGVYRLKAVKAVSY